MHNTKENSAGISKVRPGVPENRRLSEEELNVKINELWEKKVPQMKNTEKIRIIVDSQVEKYRHLSEISKMPLPKQDIDALLALAKLVAEGESLNKIEKNKADDFSPEELLLIYEHRKKQKK